MKLEQLNTTNNAQLREIFETCCCAQRWINAMLSYHPFKDKNAILKASDNAFSQLSDADYLESFTGHPQIGNLKTLQAKYANTSTTASHEQAGMSNAEASLLKEMHALNIEYLEKFGFIFIVCASGKSAQQMLELIKSRIDNQPHIELAIAANEQRKITTLRLEKLL